MGETGGGGWESWEADFLVKVEPQLGHTTGLGFDCAHRRKEGVSWLRAHHRQKPRARNGHVPSILRRIIGSEDSVQRQEDIDLVARWGGLRA